MICLPPTSSRAIRHAVLAIGLVLWGSAATRAADGSAESIGDPAYLAELTRQADGLKLWDERMWHLLLRYERGMWGGVESEADGAGFFNSPRGKHDPVAEGEATLAAFFSSRILEPGGQTAQCTFPARFHWLHERLRFDPARLPRQPCDRFDRWRASLDVEAVTLVFASFYFNNPASMFGHTLLLLNQRGRPPAQRMLDYAVNYAAVIPEGDSAAAFVANGLVGGYQGRFSMLPYYIKIKEYSDMESRDLWEYRLALTPPQVERLVRHLWEMGSTWFDYFFFKENCSYHLLALLEVADPRLRLRERFGLWTLPSDTVRAVLEAEGLRPEVTYRPSRGSRMAAKLDALEREERRLVARLIETPGEAESVDFQWLAVPRRVLVLDTAVDYHQYHLASSGEDAAPYHRSKLRELLLHRSRLRPEGPAAPAPYTAEGPERGHRSSKAALHGGQSKPGGSFADVTAQASYHDLLSADAAFARNSHINLLKLRLRHEMEADRTRLEEFMVAEVLSLFPRTLLLDTWAWRGRAGWERNRDGGCADCTPFLLQGALGLAVETGAIGRETWFGLAEASVETHDQFGQGYRAGLGATMGVLAAFTNGWRLLLAATAMDYAGHGSGTLRRVEARQRVTLTTNLELELVYLRRNDHREARLGLGWYF